MTRIEVPMPQMGESIAEGTVSKWLKQVGDPVERDEPILEISTDKVDAEIPSPESGILVEVLTPEGETVEVGAVVAYIETEADKTPAVPADTAPTVPAGTAPTVPEEAPEVVSAEPVGAGVSSSDGHATQAARGGSVTATGEERVQTRSTPVVRRIAAEHGISIEDVPGTGHAGRVTKQDILDFIKNGAPRASAAASARSRAAGPSAAAAGAAAAIVPASSLDSGTSTELWAAFYDEVHHPEFPVRDGDHVEPMDKIRRLTAEHMVLAKRVAPHVHSFIEIDFSLVDHHRVAHKGQWAAQGTRVSFTAFVVWACSRLLRKYPAINGTVSGNNIIHRGSVNVGMAVDLDPGLILPVIHDTDELSLYKGLKEAGLFDPVQAA